ncbi:MAG: L,D-transpeptidase family protein, partial [Pseudomonadota bacterium]
MLNRRALLAGLATATPLVVPATRALAQNAAPLPPKAPATAEIDTTQLAPGSYIWHPELSPDGPVAMIVSLPDQLVHVYRNGVEIGVSTVSTGKPGHETPTGVFVILQRRDHRQCLATIRDRGKHRDNAERPRPPVVGRQHRLDVTRAVLQVGQRRGERANNRIRGHIFRADPRHGSRPKHALSHLHVLLLPG